MIFDMQGLHEALSIAPPYSLFAYSKEAYKKKNCYKIVLIPKKKGGMRVLQVPEWRTKQLQRKLLPFLCWGKISPYATAYRKGKNISTNASPHVGAPLVMKLDLEDFFGTIQFGQVFTAIDRALELCPEIGKNPDKKGNPTHNGILSWYMTHICTLEGRLPQGAPTSPVLSNLICYDLDMKIGSYCDKQGITYTRYSDDMTFSGWFSLGEIITFVRKAIKEEGFFLNEEKTVVAGGGMQKKVTGIVVNEKLQVERSQRKELRKQLYYIGKFGLKGHMQHLGMQECSIEEGQHLLNQLCGKVEYVLQIDKENKEFLQYRQELKQLRRMVPELLSVEDKKKDE